MASCASRGKVPEIIGQPFIVFRYSIRSDRQVFWAMFDEMIRFSQIRQVMESSEIATSKTCKNWVAINIAFSVGYKIFY